MQTSGALTIESVAVLKLMTARVYGIGNVNVRNENLLVFCDISYRPDVEFAFVKGIAGVGVAAVVEPSGAGMEIYTASSAICGCQGE